METKPTIMVSYIFTVTYILLLYTNTTHCQICQTTATTTVQQPQRSDFSFCCCRNIHTTTTQHTHNTSSTYYAVEIKINSVFTIYQNITNTSSWNLFDNNLHACLLATSVLSSDTNMTEECHCTNTYNDLNQHRLVNVSQGYTCPKPQIIIGRLRLY